MHKSVHPFGGTPHTRDRAFYDSVQFGRYSREINPPSAGGGASPASSGLGVILTPGGSLDRSRKVVTIQTDLTVLASTLGECVFCRRPNAYGVPLGASGGLIPELAAGFFLCAQLIAQIILGNRDDPRKMAILGARTRFRRHKGVGAVQKSVAP